MVEEAGDTEKLDMVVPVAVMVDIDGGDKVLVRGYIPQEVDMVLGFVRPKFELPSVAEEDTILDKAVDIHNHPSPRIRMCLLNPTNIRRKLNSHSPVLVLVCTWDGRCQDKGPKRMSLSRRFHRRKIPIGIHHRQALEGDIPLDTACSRREKRKVGSTNIHRRLRAWELELALA